jgi:hypothetical protein
LIARWAPWRRLSICSAKSNKHAPGGRQRSVLRRAVKQRFAQLEFKPANCLTDGGLRAMQRLGRPRKTLLPGDRESKPRVG